MTPEQEREAAWGAVHDALAPRWRVGPVTYDPGARQWRSGASLCQTRKAPTRSSRGSAFSRFSTVDCTGKTQYAPLS